jgi:hypothetical protein
MKLHTIPVKMTSAIRRGGLGELCRIVGNSLVTNFSPRGRRFKQYLANCDIEFDRERGTDTSGIISQWDVGPVVGSRLWASWYQGTDAAELRGVFDELSASLDFADYTFLDLGSGKGRALLVAAEYAFRSVVGVEHSSMLHEIAEKNICVDCGVRRCKNVKSILGDATTFVVPAEGSLLVYMYNPFGRSPIEQVLDNLLAAVAREAREILILFYTEHADCTPEMFTKRGILPVSVAGKFTVYRIAGQPERC